MLAEGPDCYVAKALNEWLTDVIQNTVPVFSNEIYAGTRWFEIICKQLESSNFAILCITRENAKSPWVNFEAGACGKHMDIARVVPFLIDGEPTDYAPPISMFHRVIRYAPRERRVIEVLRRGRD